MLWATRINFQRWQSSVAYRERHGNVDTLMLKSLGFGGIQGIIWSTKDILCAQNAKTTYKSSTPGVVLMDHL